MDDRFLPRKTPALKEEDRVAIASARRDNSPKESDVVFGRGKAIANLPGNIAFRRKVEEYVDVYEQATLGGKQPVVYNIIEWVTSVQNGRFLKYTRAQQLEEVGREEQLIKVAHALRYQRRRGRGGDRAAGRKSVSSNGYDNDDTIASRTASYTRMLPSSTTAALPETSRAAEVVHKNPAGTLGLGPPPSSSVGEDAPIQQLDPDIINMLRQGLRQGVFDDDRKKKHP